MTRPRYLEPVTNEEPTAEDDALAEEIVREAMTGFEHVIPPQVFDAIFHYLVDELVCTSYGRAELRRCRSDPKVDRSGEVSRLEDAAADAIKKDRSAG